MTGLRPPLVIATFVLQAIWLVVVIDAYNTEFGSNIDSTSVMLAAIGFVWAAPAIALGVLAWLFEQALRVREHPPPPPASAAPPPPAA
jgi:hypothetical protein